MTFQDIVNYLLSDANMQSPWFARWAWILLVPLAVGASAGLSLAFVEDEGTRSQRLDEEGKRASPDIAAGLTFLGALLTGIGSLNKYLTEGQDPKVSPDDLAVLFAANIVFTALGASYVVVSGKIGRVASGLVLAGAVATLTSIGVIIWRVSYQQPQELPGAIRLLFTLLLAAAAVSIWVYVQRGLPRKNFKKVQSAAQPTKTDLAVTPTSAGVRNGTTNVPADGPAHITQQTPTPNGSGQ